MIMKLQLCIKKLRYFFKWEAYNISNFLPEYYNTTWIFKLMLSNKQN